MRKIVIDAPTATPKWMVEAARQFLTYVGLNAPLDVFLMPQRRIKIPRLKTRRGSIVLGVFSSRKTHPGIIVACRQKGSRQLRLFWLIQTLAHEWCHYEKWRDGKVQNHRGVPQRTDALTLRFSTVYHA
jgi:hypothetical protein